MSTPRTHLTATPLANGRILVVSDSTAELFDPTTDTWSPAGTLSQPRRLHVAVRLADGRVVVAGGGQYSATAELYDPTTETFSATGSMTEARMRHSATILSDGIVLVAGGADRDYSRLTSAELYFP